MSYITIDVTNTRMEQTNRNMHDYRECKDVRNDHKRESDRSSLKR